VRLPTQSCPPGRFVRSRGDAAVARRWKVCANLYGPAVSMCSNVRARKQSLGRTQLSPAQWEIARPPPRFQRAIATLAAWMTWADTARSQPADQPEAVPAGLEGDRNTIDLVPGLLRLCSPSLEQL
jgi:hypothetical protein